jgi:selenocysteine lyase/cysteine desulfurase
MVPLYANAATASEDEIVGSLAAAITPMTRVVALTWVHSSTGVKLPLRALADVVKAANASREVDDRALLCVDGVHGFGAEEADLPSLGRDFFVAGLSQVVVRPARHRFRMG